MPYGKAPPTSMSSAILFLMLCKVGLFFSSLFLYFESNAHIHPKRHRLTLEICHGVAENSPVNMGIFTTPVVFVRIDLSINRLTRGSQRRFPQILSAVALICPHGSLGVASPAAC